MLSLIHSKFILDSIFKNIRNKRKLNLIKYNKSLLNTLNITKEDFNAYLTLHEFNKKYNTNIEDIDIKELDLSQNNIGNEGLKFLCEIKFTHLIKLNLCYNLKKNENKNIDIVNYILSNMNKTSDKISDINVLEKINLNNLKELYLSHNNISDINVLQTVNFDNINIINLSSNKIKNVDILEKTKFKELKILDLSWNEINNINILDKVNFVKLKELNLSNNRIKEINVLKNVKFEKLEILLLDNNAIKNINGLENEYLKELTILNLTNNMISDITPLEKAKLEKLEKLFFKIIMK